MDEKSEHGDHPAEILEPVVNALGEEGMDISMDAVDTDQTDIPAVEPTENAGVSEDAGTPEVTESNNESTHINDENNLISELNDVTLSAATTTETDSFLDSFTTETTPSEPQTTDEQTSNAADSDLSMPSLVLPDEPDISPEDVNLEEKSLEPVEPILEPPKEPSEAPTEEMKEEAQKVPVYSLEEELERMHEESVPDQPDSEPVHKQVPEKMEEVNVPDIKTPKENRQTPIMKDSDLEEMLAAEDVLQDPLMIKSAQQELKQVDVLVCGNCHEVFHFVEEFKSHKSKTCSPKQNSTQITDNKPQVWAFALWKTKQLKHQSGRGQGQWELYKNWCGLPEVERTAWVSAGELLQFCHKLETAKVTEVKVHNKAVAKDDKDPLSLDGFDSNKENSSVDNSKSPLLEVKRTVINKPKAVPTVPKVNNNANTNKAMRSAPNLDKSEYAVEKIAAKRFNPKKKTWEYQIKWEHFSSEHNTWEPLSNLNHCRQMVDEFEDQLKKLKEVKAKQHQSGGGVVKSNPRGRPPGSTNAHSSAAAASLMSSVGSKNRPQRTSKQKALNQVKAWCGNISDEEGISLKRSRSPDSDESFEKRLKYEEMSEDSDTEVLKPKLPLRKLAPKPSASPLQVVKNGVGKNTPLPQNILIPDANGVVRINQKQLPSLSTGVYIMSKTAGIIKLDSSTSKVATSSGQMIVKVAPKIGQTHIKIMKKDGTSTQQVVQMSPKGVQQTPKALKSHLIKAKKSLAELKASPILPKKTEVIKKTILPKPEVDKKQMVIKKLPELTPKQNPKALSRPDAKEDESDDGLEELPFPEEIKLPEPEEEEENRDFILDPTTGKIAGVEYPEPEPEPIEEAKSDSSLDNIVKLAAADITEEDLKNEPQDEPMDIEVHQLVQTAEPVKIIKTEPQIVSERRFSTAASTKQVVKMPVTSRKVIANPTSILNKALTGPQVIRRAVPGSAEKQQQRVLNHSMARPIVNSVVRQTKTFVRTKPVAPKPRFNIANDMPDKFIQPEHNTSPKNVYSFTRQVVSSPTMRKIGSTTIRNSPGGMSQVNSQPKVQTKYVRTSSGLVQKVVTQVRREPVQVRGQPERIERKVVQQKPKTVINMPSLISDDDLLLTTKPTQKPKQLTSAVQPVQTIATLEATESEETQEAHKVAVVSEPSITQVPVAIQQEPEEHVDAAADNSGINALAPDMSSFTLNDNDHPIFITGDDGTVYQVAGQNEQGQTILLTQGSDGQQQCLLVTNEIAESMETPAEEEAQPQQEIVPEISPAVTDPLSIKTDVADNSDQQVVAQVVRTEPPSPGGTHKVVVMLPDGNLMITQVSPEEYASLELE